MSAPPTGDHLLGAASDLLPDGVIAVAADGRIAAVNVRAERLAGSGLVGRDAAEALVLHDESGTEWWSCVRPLSGDARLMPRISETYLRLTRADGTSRLVTLTGARLAGPDGTPAGLVLSLRRAERRRRVDEARSDLISTVSHEIRSPLTSVKGFTKTLLAKWDRFTDEQKRQMLATINEDADRVTRLLGELLDVSRIDAGRVQLRRQMISLPDVVDGVLKRLGVHGDAERLVTDFPAQLPSLYADPDKVGQVLTNLVENGLKYGEGVVCVGAALHPSEVEIVVTDHGPGIPDGQRERIFGKFFRRAGERRHGTGLGLYISRGLVEAHGGRIWAARAPEGGAAFHFTLPRGGLELAGIELPPTLSTASDLDRRPPP